MHGAAGWQMNRHAYRLTQRLGFDYCSDTRGTHPFVPLYEAEIIACPQLPTTLPTLDELIGIDGITRRQRGRPAPARSRTSAVPPVTSTRCTPNSKAASSRRSSSNCSTGWKDQGYELVSLRDYFDALPSKDLPRHDVAAGAVEGRTGTLAVQGPEFLAAHAA